MASALNLRVICHHYIQAQLRYNFLPLLRVNSYLDYKKTLATFLYIFSVVFQIVCPQFPYHQHELFTKPDLRSAFRYIPHRRVFWRFSTTNWIPSKSPSSAVRTGSLSLFQNRPFVMLTEGQCYSFYLLSVPLCAQRVCFLPSHFKRQSKNGVLKTGRGLC